MISLSVRGSTRLANRFRTLAARNAQILDPVVKDYSQDLRRTLKSEPYAPKPPQSTYQRTGKLANSWAVVKIAPAAYAIQNSQPYSQWVVDENKQVHFHAANGWWTVQQIERRGRKGLTLALVREIQDYVT